MSDQQIPQISGNPLTVAIIGAGIAGLTAAIALSRIGAKVQLFEQAEVLGEIGASIQLSPNATNILRLLGIDETLRPHWIKPQSVRLTDARSLNIVTEIPVAELAKDHWGAPYVVMPRSELQKALYQTMKECENCEIVLASQLNFLGPNRLINDLAEKIGQKPDLVIGADGLWSPTRKVLPLTGDPQFTNYIAWRMNADEHVRAKLPDHVAKSDSVHVLMGSGSHTVLYPPDKRGISNIVFITKSKTKDVGDDDLAEILKQTSLNAHVEDMIKSAELLGQWPIHQMSDGTWSNGRNIVMVGDSAHAMMPFAAQGAAMAIEDGYLLAKRIADNLDNQVLALKTFEQDRKSRIKAVKKRTNFNKFVYHANGPIRWGRDLVLSQRSPQSLAKDLDWLYSWKPE